MSASTSRKEFKPVIQRWEGGRCHPSAAPSSIPMTMPRAAESPPTLALAMMACSKLLWYLRKSCKKFRWRNLVKARGAVLQSEIQSGWQCALRRRCLSHFDGLRLAYIPKPRHAGDSDVIHKLLPRKSAGRIVCFGHFGDGGVQPCANGFVGAEGGSLLERLLQGGVAVDDAPQSTCILHHYWLRM